MEYFNDIIIEFFKEFNIKGVRYCVLRNYRSVQEINEAEDLDVSVAEDDKEKAQGVLSQLGWMTPSINLNKYGHQQYYKWDGVRLYKLDIIWGFYFADGKYTISNPDNIYLNCVSFFEAKIPRAKDGINLLFYHVLLDKGFLSANNKEQLQWLLSKDEVCINSMGRELFETELTPDKKSSILALLLEQQQIVKKKKIKHRISFFFKRALLFSRNKTFKVAFIGVDGAGKSTVVNSLLDYYKDDASIQYFGFRNYVTDIAKKRFDCKGNKKNIPFISSFVSIIIQYYDMVVRYKQVMRTTSKLKIFDRYVWEAYENADTIMTRLLYQILYKLLFPGVDGVVYLYCPEEISLQRKDDIDNKQQFIAKKRHIDSIYLKKNNVKKIDTYATSKENVMGESVSFIFSLSHGLIK